jgi:hypothetical protein
MTKYTLAELLSQCTPENRHEELFADNPQVIDLLANLAWRIVEIERELNEYKALGIRDHLREGNNVLNNRVTSLESQLRSTQRNVETWAEQTESNTQDIAMLDERTYPKEEADEITPDESIPKYYAEMLVKFYERRDR